MADGDQGTARQSAAASTKSKSERTGIFRNFKLFALLNLLGYGITASTFYYGYHYGDFIIPASLSNETVALDVRLAFGLRCSLPLALCVFFAVAMVGNKRAVSDAVDPLSGNENIVQIDKNFLANTLEQCVIGFILMLIMASYCETPKELRLLPIFAAVFTVARVVFRIG